MEGSARAAEAIGIQAAALAEELFERRRQLKGDTPSPAMTLGKNV